MEALSNQKYYVLDAFQVWLGYKLDFSLIELLKINDEDLLRLASQKLYNPPSENLITSDIFDYCDPTVDILFKKLSQKYNLVPLPFWPHDAPYVVSITHDIDRIFSTVHSLKKFDIIKTIQDIRSFLQKQHNTKNPYYNFDNLLDFNSRYNIKSAVYVLQEKRRFAKSILLRELQHCIGVYKIQQIEHELIKLYNNNIEIGIHGSFDSWDSEVKLKCEIENLNKIGIQNIRGIRNHYLQFDHIKSPRSLINNNFQYDSTIGFNFKSGFRSGTAFPYLINGIIELPLNIMDTSLNHMTLDLKRQIEIKDHVLNNVKIVGGVLMCNWHLQFLNQVEYPDQYTLFSSIIERAKLDGAWIALPSEISSHWQKRINGIQ